MGNIVWWILGLAVVGGGAYVISRSGKKVAKKDACVADMPEPMRGQARDAAAKKDGARLLAYAKQARAAGWSCAASELDEQARLAGAAPTDAERKLADAEKALDAARRAKLSLVDVSKTADQRIRDQAAAALALTLRPKIGSADTVVDYKTIKFERRPTAAVVQQVDDLAAALGVAGYSLAQSQARDMADAARRARDASATADATGPSAAEYGGAFSTEFEVPASSKVDVPTSPLDALDDPPRESVKAHVAAGDVDALLGDAVLLTSLSATDAVAYVRSVIDGLKFASVKRDTSGAMRDKILFELENAIIAVPGLLGTGGSDTSTWAAWRDRLVADRDAWRKAGVSEAALAEVQGVIDGIVGFNDIGPSSKWYVGWVTAATGSLPGAS
jgi:hypothetical protein